MKAARIAARHVLLLVGTMSAAIATPVQSLPDGHPVFAPPEGKPMFLTRTVRRELSDGKAIVATRTYRVSFVRSDRGWNVEGELIASEVECPPVLAALAAIERQRPDDALFPIHLDPAGLIQPREGTTTPDGPA